MSAVLPVKVGRFFVQMLKFSYVKIIMPVLFSYMKTYYYLCNVIKKITRAATLIRGTIKIKVL